MDGTSVHEVNRPIPLGEMEIGFVIDERSVRVAAEAFENLLPSPHVVLKVTNVPRQLQNSGPLMSEGPSTVTIERGTPVDVVPSPWVVFQQDNTLRLAHSPSVVLYSYEPLARVEFNVLNFSWSGGQHSIALKCPPWSVNIKAVSNLSNLTEKLGEDGGFAVTHTGTLERSDGTTFSSEDAQTLLMALDHFLSFVCGARCATTNVIGFGSEGNESWKRWGSYGVSAWGPYRSWFDITAMEALPELFPTFWKQYREKPGLGRILRLYSYSNACKSVDISNIVTQTILEVFASWDKLKGKTGERIAGVLKNSDIDTEIPSNFEELERMRTTNSWEHGPHTLVKLRNSWSHADSDHSSGSVKAYYQAKQLGLWYVELLLLRMFKYMGKYASRLSDVQKPGKTEPVPWASGTERQI